MQSLFSYQCMHNILVCKDRGLRIVAHLPTFVSRLGMDKTSQNL